MGSFERSKKKIQLWKKALVHFSLCFVMGFFTGFAPTSKSVHPHNHFYATIPNFIKPDPIEPLHKLPSQNRTLLSQPQTETQTEPDDDDLPESNPPGLLIVITTTSSDDRFKRAGLTRLAHTLRLVRSPLVWIVVEAHSEAGSTAEMLRRTGIMYRHLTFRENFTDPYAETHHQRNIALSHVEHHRLTGVVHFSDVGTVYDLQFFDEIRQIEVFGTWPVAKVSASRKKVLVEGPLCRQTKVVGWFSKDWSAGPSSTVNHASSQSDTSASLSDGALTSSQSKELPQTMDVSGFAFNSSVLWDPERWGRPTSLPDTSQDSIKFVQEIVLEDEAKLKGIPSDCSQIMLWQTYTPRATPLPSTQNPNQSR